MMATTRIRIALAAMFALSFAADSFAAGEGSNPDDPRVLAFRAQAEAFRERLGIPGLSAVILEDGEVLWTEGLGYADLEKKIPATPDTLYHIASVTKTFTAILVHREVERGRLDLDAPVMRYDPTITDPRIRIKHLLSHTADNRPGDAFAYNPDKFEHLKAVLEAVEHKPLRLQFAEEILDPVGMTASVPGPDVADDAGKWALLGPARLARYQAALANEAKGYTTWGDRDIEYSGSPPRDFWASAGLLSSVRDLAKYDQAIDDHALLAQATLDRAWTPFVSNAGKPLAFGLGWYVTDYRGERLVTHYGHWGQGFSALYLKVPARRLTLILLANSENLADHHYKIGGEDVTNDVFACRFLTTFIPSLANGTYPGTVPTGNLDAMLADKAARDAAAKRALVPDSPTRVSNDCELTSRIALADWADVRREAVQARKPIAMDPAWAAEYAGTYRLPHRDIVVTNEGGRLFMNVPRDGGHAELHPESPTTFFLRIRPWDLVFVKENGKVVRLDFIEGNVTDSAPTIE
jgi:CubicO group peptidase (beta-lactamase class C family)